MQRGVWIISSHQQTKSDSQSRAAAKPLCNSTSWISGYQFYCSSIAHSVWYAQVPSQSDAAVRLWRSRVVELIHLVICVKYLSRADLEEHSRDTKESAAGWRVLFQQHRSLFRADAVGLSSHTCTHSYHHSLGSNSFCLDSTKWCVTNNRSTVSLSQNGVFMHRPVLRSTVLLVIVLSLCS